MKIKNRSVQILVDSGSSTSLISLELARKLKLKIKSMVGGTPLVSANGQPLKQVGIADINFYVKGLNIYHTLKVVQGLYPSIIIGVDFMRLNQMNIDYVNNNVQFYDGMLILPLQEYTDLNNCAVVSETMCIPKFAEAIIPIIVPCHLQNRTVILEPLANRYEVVAVAGAITNTRGRQAVLKVLNYQPVSVSLRKGMKIARIVSPHSVASVRFLTSQIFPRKLQKPKIAIL